jgi:hypothetical protein
MDIFHILTDQQGEGPSNSKLSSPLMFHTVFIRCIVEIDQGLHVATPMRMWCFRKLKGAGQQTKLNLCNFCKYIFLNIVAVKRHKNKEWAKP